jgi:hypothetical protein
MKIRLCILDDDNNTLASTTIDRKKYYRTRIKHGKGLLDDVHKELSKQLPIDTIGFAVFYFERTIPGNELNLTLRTKIIPTSFVDEFIDEFGERIISLNPHNGLTEQEITNFINQRIDNPQT